MNVIGNFEERRREKQMMNERKLLRDLPINELKKVSFFIFMQQEFIPDCLMMV
ncbi:DUF2521 family protein [Bacillus sp. N9]